MEIIKKQDLLDLAPNSDSANAAYERACVLILDTLALNNIEPTMAWEALATVLTGAYEETDGSVEYFLHSVNAYMRAVIEARGS